MVISTTIPEPPANVWLLLVSFLVKLSPFHPQSRQLVRLTLCVFEAELYLIFESIDFPLEPG
jgi:hypothetical protein